MSRMEFDHVHTPLDMTKVRPYQDHILVRQYENEMSEGGVYYPGEEKTSCYFGEVIRVGSGVVNPKDGTLHPIPVKPGDYVIVMKYAGENITSPDAKHKLIKEVGIWATFKGEVREGYVRIDELEPYGDRILTRPFKNTRFTGTSILVPNEDPRSKWNRFEVLKVGPGPIHWKRNRREAFPVNPGETVVARRYSGTDLVVAGEPLRLIEGSDIQSVVEGEIE